MGFLDALRAWGGDRSTDRLDALGAVGGDTSHPEFPRRVPAADPDKMAAPPDTSAYDREQWRKKLKRILAHLPRSQPEWDDLIQESGALNLGNEWVAATYREEFTMMVRQIVSDRVVTPEEHRNLDLARAALGISDAEAERILHEVVQEAETFFGGKVEGA